MSNLWQDDEEEFQDKPQEAASLPPKPLSAQELAQQLIPPLATAPLPPANRPEPPRGFTPRTAPSEPEVAVFEGDPELDLFPDGDDEDEDFSAVLNDASL